MQNNQQMGQGQQKPQFNAAPQQNQNKPGTQQAPQNMNKQPQQQARPAQTVNASQPASRSTMMWVMGGVVVGLIVVLGWAGLRSGADKDKEGVISTSGTTATSSTSGTGDTLGTLTGTTVDSGSTVVVVPPTQDAGNTVIVTSISSSMPVWAVVYQNDNGKTGRVLGAARFTPERTSGTVELLAPTLSGLTYFVGLAADTVDHSFAIRSNSPLLGADGKQIMVSFTAR